MAILQFILPFIAVSIVVIATIANFTGTIKKFRKGDPATLSLVLVTMLMAAYGVERYVNYTQLEQKLSSIESRLSFVVGGRLINNNKEIYESAAKLFDTFEGRIRAVVVSAGPKVPQTFVDKVAQKLKERKELGFPIKYEVVLVLSPDQVADLDRFEKANNDRINFYNQYGVAEAISLYVLESNTFANFDVLIVDRKHAHFGFTVSRGEEKLESAILYENQPQLSQSLTDWFDGAVLPKAKPWNEWLKEQRVKRQKAA
jgi:hypothetical protein